VLGTATGNLAAIGRAKLERAGLMEMLDFGGWSDGCETRGEVFRLAAAAARERTQPIAAICVVGDTPADIRAARENDLKVIAVATGIYSRETLQAEQPDLLLSSLDELLVSPPPAKGTHR
jgi:phosphoglycolate phosphatase-like HAD superfamily hydrolase